MALTADRKPPLKGRGAQHSRLRYKVAASTTIWSGAIVSVNATGYLKLATDTAGERVVGIADERVDNSSGAAGDKLCWVVEGEFEIPYSEDAGEDIRQDDLATVAVVEDSEKVARAGSQTNNLGIGRVFAVDTTLKRAWIDVRASGAV